MSSNLQRILVVAGVLVALAAGLGAVVHVSAAPPRAPVADRCETARAALVQQDQAFQADLREWRAENPNGVPDGWYDDRETVTAGRLWAQTVVDNADCGLDRATVTIARKFLELPLLLGS